MAYKSIKYISCNEAGEQEVEIIYEKSLWRWLFRLPELIETYVGEGTVWYHKGTGNRAGTLKESEICDVVEYFRQTNTYNIYKE